MNLKEKQFVEWIKKRNLNVLPHQLSICSTLLPESLIKNSLPTVLAVTASGGKTLMSIYQVEQFVKDNPKAKVLIFAHGTDVLRSQYFENLTKLKPDFKFKLLKNKQDLIDSYKNHNVFVALPHTFHTIKDLSNYKFDFLVVDEAHQFYFAKGKSGKSGMVQKIIAICKPKYQLLLTGTPSPFILRKYPIIAVAANEIMDTGQIEDVLVENVTSTYNIKAKDYNADHNLRTGVKLTKKQTEETLMVFLRQLVERLSHTYRNDPEKYAEWKYAKDWTSPKIIGNITNKLSNFISPSTIGKMMIACYNQKQAENVASFFKDRGINVALSTSDVDKDSSEIQRFKTDKDCTILVVVYRGVLGFDLKELEVVVDMTASENFDRVFQLMARVLRVHPKGHKKIFFKIVPQGLEEYFLFIMKGVICLTDKSYLTTFNGKNFWDINVPYLKIKKPKSNNGNGSGKSTPKENRKRQIKNIEFIGLPAIEFFKDIIHKNNDEFSPYAYTTMREVRNLFLLDKFNWTKEAVWATITGE